jgi:hypothetical protein
MDFATRRKLFNACDPDKSLEPLDKFNVNVEELEGGASVRGDEWLKRTRQRLELSEQPLCELLTGLPGSGKSTELKRLAAELEQAHEQKQLVVYIDAEENLDLTNTIDVPDLLITIVYAAERRVLEVEGKPADGALQDRKWRDWLRSLEPALKEVGVGVGAASLTFELKANPALRKRMRAIVAVQLPRFLGEVREELVKLESRAIDKGYQGVTVIYDSLEKLRGISTNYDEVLASAERVFAPNLSFVKLPVHVVYTVPPSLPLRARMSVEFFPMLKLRTREGDEFPPGLAAAREIVRRRVPDGALEEQLGEAWESRLRELLLWSGGFPREIVRLLRAVVEPEAPLSDYAFERLLARTTDDYKHMIRTSEHAWLAAVAVRKELPIANDAERAIASRMLSSNAVMRYVNQQDWWDLHPAVRNIPAVEAAIEELQKPE